MDRLPTPAEHDALLEDWCAVVEGLMCRHGHARLSLMLMVSAADGAGKGGASEEAPAPAGAPAQSELIHGGARWAARLLDMTGPYLTAAQDDPNGGIVPNEPTPLHPDFLRTGARWQGLALALCQRLHPDWLAPDFRSNDVGASLEAVEYRGPGSVLRWLLECDQAHAARWRARRLDDALVAGQPPERDRL